MLLQRRTGVVMSHIQRDWGSVPLYIVKLWSIMVVLWKKRRKICARRADKWAILRPFHRKRAIFLVVGQHFCMCIQSDTVVDVVWTGEWVHWDRNALSPSWNLFFLKFRELDLAATSIGPWDVRVKGTEWWLWWSKWSVRCMLMLVEPKNRVNKHVGSLQGWMFDVVWETSFVVWLDTLKSC